MNYTKHYNLLIERANNRKLDGYKERHHIIPRCIGGGDNKENIVELTPEEHYTAHQLLLKMYPNEPGLVYAAVCMTGRNEYQQRNNKLHGWLRRKHTDVMRMKTGERNPSYGSCWVSNFETRECKKIKLCELDTYIVAGWAKQRVMDWSLYDETGKRVWVKPCKECGKLFKASGERNVLCSNICKREAQRTVWMKIIDENLDEMVNLFDRYGSIDRVLREYGLPGRAGNSYLSKILKKNGRVVLKRRNTATVA